MAELLPPALQIFTGSLGVRRYRLHALPLRVGQQRPSLRGAHSVPGAQSLRTERDHQRDAEQLRSSTINPVALVIPRLYPATGGSLW